MENQNEKGNHYPTQRKQIIYNDFRDCGMEDVFQVIGQAAPLIRTQPEKSVLILSDFTGSVHNAQLLSALREFTAGNAPHVKASAIIGMTGMKKVLYDTVMKFTGRNIPIFDDADQAKEWLVTQ
jgi:hypothetical protein